ncbi:MAG: restriction endonuclease subunit S [Alphaproteobacteria bacterium]|jgi:type I restriction enzyme S subunit|nr:restriction endonuclease subunit S [Alphaproteobacteria bacterium]
MIKWIETTLGDVCDIKHGYAFKGDFITSEKFKNILLTPGNFSIGGGFNSKKFKYYSSDDFPKSYILKEGDLLVSMTDLSKKADTLGYPLKVPNSNEFVYLHNQRLGLVENLNCEKIDKEFLYWLMRTSFYQRYIANGATGSTVKHTSPSRILQFSTFIPEDVEIQREIAGVLSSLDDKIELLQEQNKTLEELAQTIFTETFITNPNSDWKEGVLDDVSDFKNGYPFSSKELSKDKVGIPVLKMGNILKGGGLTLEKFVSYFAGDVSNKISSNFAEKYDILMCMTDMKSSMNLLGHTGIMFEDKKYLVNQRVGIIRPKNGYNYFLSILTNTSEFIENLRGRSNSGVQVNLSTFEIKNSKILIPDEGSMKRFNEKVEPMFEKISANIKQIATLKETRDTLLPKLISGKVKLKGM